MEQVWTQLFSILAQISAVLFVPIAGAVGTLLIQKIKQASTKIKGDKWEEITLVTKIAVSSVEQQFKAGMIKDKKDKKEAAMELAKRLLEVKKIKLEDELLSPLIEAQVWDSINAPTTAEILKDVKPIVITPPTVVTPSTTEDVPLGASNK